MAEAAVSDIGHICKRGEACADYREGYAHAHGLSGDPAAPALNHAGWCHRRLTESTRGGFPCCPCGAAIEWSP